MSKKSYLEELIHIFDVEIVQFYKKWNFYHVFKWFNGGVLCKKSYLKSIYLLNAAVRLHTPCALDATRMFGDVARAATLPVHFQNVQTVLYL